MSLKDVLKELKTYPLRLEESQWFVNREEELYQLREIAEIYEGEIVGITGERGIGKTTLFNFLSFPEKEKIIVNIRNRSSLKGIILDICYAIYKKATEKEWQKTLQKAKSLFQLLTTTSKKEMGISLSYVIGIEIKKTQELIYTPIVTKLREIIDTLPPAVIIFDEIDKQKPEEVLLIIDLLKDAFLYNKTTLFVALPYKLYSEYKRSKVLATETYNLENVFSTIVNIPRMTAENIEKIIRIRIGSYITKDAISLLTLYARGNPRKAITTTKEAGRIAILKRKNVIESEDVKAAVKMEIKTLIRELNIEEELLSILYEIEEGEKAKVVKHIAKLLGVSLSSAYRRLEKLKNKGLIEMNRYVVFTELGRIFRIFR